MQSTHEVSRHLNIRLDEYDARIRTFVPFYEEMLNVVGECVRLMAPRDGVLVELGIGTGALAQKCRSLRPDLSLVGIDADAAMLEVARRRLGPDVVDLRHGSFTMAPLPGADVIASSLALHHVSSPEEKRALYTECRAALRDGGLMVIADCYLPGLPDLAAAGMDDWAAFLALTYSPEEARSHLDAWAEEDTYFPLTDELAWMRSAGLECDVVWRQGVFAVVVCTRERSEQMPDTQGVAVSH